MNRTRELLRRPAGGVEPRKHKKDASRGNNDDNHPSRHSASSFPRKDSQGAARGTSIGNGGEEAKKWTQRITDTKIFKRLLQPPQMVADKRSNGGNSNSNNSRSHSHSQESTVPLLGEVPVRSRYYRAEQQNPHFATTVDYLPLAEVCGPPPTPTTNLQQPSQQEKEIETLRRRLSISGKHAQPHSSRTRRGSGESDTLYDGLEDYAMPVGGVDDVDMGDAAGGGEVEEEQFIEVVNYEEQDDGNMGEYNDGVVENGVGNFGVGGSYNEHTDRKNTAAVTGGLREQLVRRIPGSAQRRHYRGSSMGSCSSTSSSVGPTGLALLPQFRWVPRPGGGGHGFNPFMAFRRAQPGPPQQQQQQQQQQQRRRSPFYTLDHYNVPVSPQTTPPHTAPNENNAAAPPLQEQQRDESRMTAALSVVGAVHSGYDMYYNTPSPGSPQRGVSPLHNSFYGPIGTLGIEASRKRRELELENGAAGDAEKAYKARTARRSNLFDDGSILLITKAWCEPDMLLSARVVNSPCLPDDVDDDTSSSDSANCLECDDSSDDVAGGKPPVYDAATMAAREARVRKERVRQERRRYESADSPSFYFAGGELAALQPPLPSPSAPQQPNGAASRKGMTSPTAHMAPPSPPLRQRTPQTHTKPSPPPNKPVAAAAGREDVDSSSSDDSSDNDADSSTDSDSDSRSDASSSTDSDVDEVARGEEGEDNGGWEADGDRTPRGDTTTQAPTRGTRSSPRGGGGRALPPDTSMSVVPDASLGRNVVVGGDAGRYDFMNSSMMNGPGGSLWFPHDANEASVVAMTTAMAPLTPLHRPGGTSKNNSTSSPVYSGRGGSTGDRPGAVAPPAPPKHVSSSTAASPTVSSATAHDKGPLMARPPSGSGACAASVLRDKKQAKQTATDTRANAESPHGGAQPQQPPQQQRRGSYNVSTNSYDGGAGDMSVYGSSFHLRDARFLYSPAEEAVAAAAVGVRALPGARAKTSPPQHTPSPTSANGKSNQHHSSSSKRESTASPAEYTMAMPGAHAHRGPTESPLDFSTLTYAAPATSAAHGNPQNRNPAVFPSLSANDNSNSNGARTSTVSPAGTSMSTGDYNSRPSSLAPRISPPTAASRPWSLIPQSHPDGRRIASATSPTNAPSSWTAQGPRR